jgi:hypothetical protein
LESPRRLHHRHLSFSTPNEATSPALPTTPQDVSATIDALRINQADYQQLFVGVLFLDYNAGQVLRYVRLIRVTENANSLTTSTTNVTGPGPLTGDAGSVGGGLDSHRMPRLSRGW